jgi:hypothetical protein
VKVDFVAPYTPPAATIPAQLVQGVTTNISFSPVAGAGSYRVRIINPTPLTETDGAERGLVNWTPTTTGGYSLLANDVKWEGTASFHLALVTTNPVQEVLTYKKKIRPATNSSLVFFSRLGHAQVAQKARAQVSLDEGKTWETIWIKSGTGGPGELNFNQQSVSLTRFMGKSLLLRFTFYSEGAWTLGAGTGIGFYLDNISFLNVNEEKNEQFLEVTEPQFIFNPTVTGNYLVEISPRIAGSDLPFGPARQFTVVAPSLLVQISQIRRVTPTRVEIDFQRLNGTNASFQLETSTNLLNGWVRDTGATQTNLGNGTFRLVSTLPAVNSRFYRVKVNP